jgi:hypothetical protein
MDQEDLFTKRNCMISGNSSQGGVFEVKQIARGSSLKTVGYGSAEISESNQAMDQP